MENPQFTSNDLKNVFRNILKESICTENVLLNAEYFIPYTTHINNKYHDSFAYGCRPLAYLITVYIMFLSRMFWNIILPNYANYKNVLGILWPNYCTCTARKRWFNLEIPKISSCIMNHMH